MVQLSANSPSRNVRATTAQATQKSQQSPLFSNKRKSLSLKDSASIIRDENHDCNEVDTNNSKIKVNARFYFSLFRFYVAYAWDCETKRGQTYLNGATCHCGGCEAGHAALTPNLLDDKLKRICEKIIAGDFNMLENHEKEYMRKQFNLVDEDIRELSNKRSRTQHLDAIQSHLSSNEKLGTFVNTPVGNGRAATFSNPRASNRIDCHLEYRLRPVEDELSKQCTNQETTPKEALEELQKKHFECLQEIAQNLNESLQKTSELSATIDHLFSCFSADPFDFDLFLDALKLYLQSHDEYFEKKSGVPQNNLKGKLNRHLPIYWIKALIKANSKEKALRTFECNKRYFIPPDDLEDLFKDVKQEISLRIKESAAQMEVAGLPYQEIHTLLKHEFGEKDASGNVITPTKKQMANKLTNFVQPRQSTVRKKIEFNP